MSVEKMNDPVIENVPLTDYSIYDEEEEDTESERTIDEELEEVSQQEKLQDLDGTSEAELKKLQKGKISKNVTALLRQEGTPKEPSWSFSTESSEEVLSTGPFVVRKKLPTKKDFFKTFGRLPDIDQISLPESLKREQLGEEDGSTVEEGEEGEGTETQAEEIPTDALTESITTEYSDFDFPFSDTDHEDLEKEISDEHLFDALIRDDGKIAIIVEEFDYEKWQRKEAQRQMMRDTLVFLKSLIEYVVEFSEYVDPKAHLRSNLNKHKLYYKIMHLLGDLHVERKVSEFLHRKCIDYYRRQKMFRPITPDSPDMLPEEMERYQTYYEALDCLLGRETATKEVITRRIAELEAEEIRLKEQIELETLATERLIRSTIRKRGIERLNILVEKKIKEMAALRPEIRQVYALLIQRQHTVAKLKDKAAAAEILGDGLHVRDFDRLENEHFGLGKKLEENSYNLHRIRNNYYTYTHMAAHLREKQTMLTLGLSVQKDKLRRAQLDRDIYREFIHDLKLSRLRVKNKIRELDFQNGILARPALMLDFDDTADKVEREKIKVDEMKENLAKINNRINRLEKCSKSAHKA